jgi:hypothetical protein
MTSAGGNRIRTIGTATAEDARRHRRYQSSVPAEFPVRVPAGLKVRIHLPPGMSLRTSGPRGLHRDRSHCASCPQERDRWFESGSLQQRVCELSVPERARRFRIAPSHSLPASAGGLGGGWLGMRVTLLEIGRRHAPDRRCSLVAFRRDRQTQRKPSPAHGATHRRRCRCRPAGRGLRAAPQH